MITHRKYHVSTKISNFQNCYWHGICFFYNDHWKSIPLSLHYFTLVKYAKMTCFWIKNLEKYRKRLTVDIYKSIITYYICLYYLLFSHNVYTNYTLYSWLHAWGPAASPESSWTAEKAQYNQFPHSGGRGLAPASDTLFFSMMPEGLASVSTLSACG